MKKNETVRGRLITSTQLIIDKYTYPVFIFDKKNKPDLIASSVVIEIDKQLYLVTASHVIDYVLNSDSLFYISINNRYLAIRSVFMSSNNSNLNCSNEPGADNFDIAFTQLDANIVSSNEIVAIPNSKLLFSELSETPYISFIHGFPTSKNKQSKSLWNTESYGIQPYAYVGDIKSNDIDWSKFNKNIKFHTCMTYKRKKVKSTPSHPSGMSGGGLWIIPSRMKPNTFYLNSIFIEYYKSDDLTFSTKISQVLEYIKNVMINEKSIKESFKDNYIKLLS